MRGDILKGSVAAIVIQRVVRKAGDEDVDESVVVVVGRGHSHRIPVARQTGLLRHIGEGHVAIVAEQAIIKLRPRFHAGGKLRAVGDKDIHAAVVVVIERRHAAQHDFGRVKVAGRSIMQDEVQARPPGDIFESNRRYDGQVDRQLVGIVR